MSLSTGCHHNNVIGASERKSSGFDSSTRKLPVVPDFNDSQAAYATKSTWELVRAMLVFHLCRIPFLVQHSETLLSCSRQILGETIHSALLKATLFGHFCAGQDEKSIQPILRQMQKHGIGSILDYAREDDGGGSTGTVAVAPKQEDLNNNNAPNASPFPWKTSTANTIFHQDPNPKARMYDYESEQQCDRHVETFRSCIRSVKNLDADGYAAVKVTALGNPKLLEKMSRALREVQNLFRKFDADMDGFITRLEFEKGYQFFFQPDNENDLEEMFQLLDANNTGQVDFITWSMLLRPSDLPQITRKCRAMGPLALASPTDEEVELMQAMFQRGHALAQEAVQSGTRLLIDAEQHRFQPAIDNLVLDLQRSYNATDQTDHPIIYNTYQCYLKDTPERLRTDIERSERHSYHFGAKIVRGAYLESERGLAASLGYDSPIHDTIQETHDCYNDSVEYLLRQSVSKTTTKLKQPALPKKIELMVASHNQSSIEKAIQVMNELNMNPSSSTICFAQLYGMSDHLTYNLGQHGYRAYKYVPYGQVAEVIPYLVRRARENSSIQGAAANELQMIQTELKRRVLGWA